MSQQWKEAPAMTLDAKKSYTAHVETEKGTLVIKLHADKTPITVNSFVFLAKRGFYDGVIFHRVIDNFMVQVGDPTGTGTGGPGYKFEDEFHPELSHDKRGIISMANAGPGTNGSQFFITHGPTPHLDGKHSVFGEIIEGEDVLMAIPARDPGNQDAPAISMISIKIIEE